MNWEDPMWVARTFPEGVPSPRLMSGPCSFIARDSRLGRGPKMPELEIRYQRLTRSVVKFPNTSFQIWGEVSTLPKPLQG